MRMGNCVLHTLLQCMVRQSMILQGILKKVGFVMQVIIQDLRDKQRESSESYQLDIRGVCDAMERKQNVHFDSISNCRR